MKKTKSSNFIISLFTLLISLLGLVITNIFSFFSGFSSSYKNNKKQNKPYHVWQSNQLQLLEVVGESNYQNNIKKLITKHDNTGINQECIAILIPENDNKYDKNAVRIDVDELTVGYLSRNDAIIFRELLKANNLENQITICNATINGGFVMDNNKKASYGIFLKI